MLNQNRAPTIHIHNQSRILKQFYLKRFYPATVIIHHIPFLPRQHQIKIDELNVGFYKIKIRF